MREAELKFRQKADGHLGQTEKKAAVERQMTPKPASASKKTITYEFSSNSYLKESYRNPWNALRIGRLLEDLDALAANVAVSHCSTEHGFPVLVTASVDRICLARRPSLERDVTLTGWVTWTGRCAHHFTSIK
jgi:acyl-coenzyme A thioesterase 9